MSQVDPPRFVSIDRPRCPRPAEDEIQAVARAVARVLENTEATITGTKEIARGELEAELRNRKCCLDAIRWGLYWMCDEGLLREEADGKSSKLIAGEPGKHGNLFAWDREQQNKAATTADPAKPIEEAKTLPENDTLSDTKENRKNSGPRKLQRFIRDAKEVKKRMAKGMNRKEAIADYAPERATAIAKSFERHPNEFRDA